MDWIKKKKKTSVVARFWTFDRGDLDLTKNEQIWGGVLPILIVAVQWRGC